MTPDQPTKGDELPAACPFCGGPAQARTRRGGISGGVELVGCMSCGADTRAFSSETEAVAAWNRRTPPTALKPQQGVDGLREKVARIIDPELDAHIANQTFAKCRALVSIAYDKTDEVVALIQPGAGSGGEEVERLQSEIAFLKRLRAALREIESPTHDKLTIGAFESHAVKIARAAPSSDSGGEK